MGFSAIDQLIAKGTPSPITSALQGFQTGAQMMPAIRMARLAPALRQAQIQLAQAQAQQALEKARNPFAAQPLSGDAAKALSNIIYKRRFADNPEALGELKAAHDRTEKAANARWFMSLPSDERGEVIGKAKNLGYDAVEATQRLGNGETLQDLANEKAIQLHAPPPGTIITPTASNAHNESPQTINKSLAEVKEATKPIRWQEITPNFAPTEAAKTRAQQSAQASAGLDYLGKYIANNLNYGGITSKITRPWLQDIYSHDPATQEKAINYYVAQAVKPELGLLRIRIQGGQASARAMAALSPTILGHISVDMANAPAKMQKRVQLRATEVLNEAAHQTELQNLAPNPNVFNPKAQEQAPKNISSTTPSAAQPTTETGTVRIRLPDGRAGTIPLKNLAQAIKMGAKRI
jgi:hypothetical protein